MRLSRDWAVRLSLAVVTAAGVASFMSLGGVFSCSTYPTYQDVPIDCTVQEAYDFEMIDDFSGQSPSWFPVADYVPPTGGADAGPREVVSGGGKDSAFMSIAIGPIPEGPLCGNTNAAVIRGHHNVDWGGMCGMWGFASGGARDASKWQGISFWARAPGNTAKGFTLLLDDDNTISGTVTGTKNCKDYTVDGGVAGPSSSTTVTVNDPGTGTPITGSSNTRAAYRDECGNSFSVVVPLTSSWKFYTIPWRKFYQNETPNRVSEKGLLSPDPGDLERAGTTLLTSKLRGLTLRMSKEADLEIWLAKLAFYGQKTH